MTKTELEHMISLIDDRYIEEATEQKIIMKKRLGSIIPITVVAAAMICGVFFAVRPSETSVENLTASDVTTIASSAATDEYNENLPYYKYFYGDISEGIQRVNETPYYYVYIPNDLTVEVADFDFKYKPQGTIIYCGRYDTELTMNMKIHAGETAEGFPKIVDMWIYRDGPLNSDLPQDATPEVINGIDVYGYEDDNLYADFILNDQGYELTFSNIGYKEAYGITAMLIDRELAVDSFNNSQEFKRSAMTIDELCETSPFGKYVPNQKQFSDMPLMQGAVNGATDYAETRIGDDVVKKALYMGYSDQLGENKGKHIQLTYKWYSYVPVYFSTENIPVSLSELDMNTMMNYAETRKNPDEINSFDFRIDCNDCVIDVDAVCTADELWECLAVIKGVPANQT